MLVEASERFAKRTAQWMMNDPNMKGAELIKRLSMFPDKFAAQVSVASSDIKRTREGQPAA